MGLIKRQTYCRDYNGYRYPCNSRWNDWGRWVFAAAIFVGFLILFFLLSCLSARRRRRRGNAPLYGTGWTGRFNGANNHPQQNPQNTYYAYQQPAPPYEMHPQHQQYGAGQQATGVERPEASYGGYAPPPGPPPGKK